MAKIGYEPTRVPREDLNSESYMVRLKQTRMTVLLYLLNGGFWKRIV